MHRWLSNLEYFYNKRFKQAMVLYPLCHLNFETKRKEWWKIKDIEVEIYKENLRMTCTCKECSLSDNMCSNKIAVLVKKTLGD